MSRCPLPLFPLSFLSQDQHGGRVQDQRRTSFLGQTPLEGLNANAVLDGLKRYGDIEHFLHRRKLYRQPILGRGFMPMRGDGEPDRQGHA